MLRLIYSLLGLFTYHLAFSTNLVVPNNFPPTGPLTIVIDSMQGVDCTHGSGYLSVSAIGGAGGYSFQWSNGATGAFSAGLAPGDYTITVMDADGKTEEISTTIDDDHLPPSVDAGPPFTVGCSNSVLTLTGAGPAGAIYTYQWTAQNGGNILSGANTLLPTINKAGKFVLVVTNTQNGCTGTDFTTVTAQYVAPIVAVQGDTITCSQSSVKLISSYNALNTNIVWQGPNGYVSSFPQPTVTVAGNYFFTVTDTISTCATKVKAVVLLDTMSPPVSVSVSGALSCQQASVQLIATSSASNLKFNWAGPNNFTSALQNPTVNAAGTYVLVVTALRNGCTAVRSLNVTGSLALPSATAVVSGALTCTVSFVSLNGSSNTPGASFSWTGPGGFTAGTQNTSTGVPGIYTLTVKNNSSGCTATATVTVQQNVTPPTITATGGNKTCANPTVQLTAQANVSGASFSWNGPSGFFSNQQNPTVSQVGNYNVTVTNPQNGCSGTAFASVGQNIAAPTVIATGGTVTCTVPQVNLKATSNTSGATFSWSGPNGFSSTLASPPASTEGYYYVTVTSPVNGCTNASSTYLYKDNTPPTAYAGEDRSLNCYFTSVVINPIGSSIGSQYAYAWTTLDGNIVSGANTLQARIDGVGTYKLVITNTQNGCTASDQMDLIQSPPVTANVGQTLNISCNGLANGSVTIVAGGGNGNYTYTWPNGAATATVNSLVAGIYKVTVTDGEGCKATATATVTEPTVLAATMSAVAQSLPNVNNGSATAVASGGTLPYTIKWNTNQVTFTIQNLAPATYTATITDNKGCTVVRSVTVNQSSCNLSGAIAVTAISCAGLTNGTATANIVGGTLPIAYKWSNNATTKTIINLPVGNYTVTATDATGCPVTLTTTITAPQPLLVSIANQVNVACPGAMSGTLTLNSSGGISPYTYNWSNGSAAATASGLSSGAYTVTIHDTNGCTKTTSATILVTDNKPPVLNLKNATVLLGANNLATVTPQMFDNGSLDVDCSIVSWTVTPTSFDCNKIGTNVVTITATDGNGNSSSGTALVTVQDNIAPVLTCPTNILAGSCQPVVQFNLPQVTDNCPSSLENLILSQGLPSGSVFPAGTTQQQFKYVDAAGNQAVCAFTVTIVPAIQVSVQVQTSMCSGACSGQASVQISGGTANSIFWSNGQTGQQVTNLCPGAYSVTVQDPYGCVQTRSFDVNGSDIEAPVLLLQTPSLTLDASGVVVLTPAMFDAGSTDNCGIASWTFEPSFFDCSTLGTQTVHIMVRDLNGNAADQTLQVSVLDPIGPQVQCPANQSVPYCQTFVTYNLPVVTDNCSVNPAALQMTAGLASGTNFPGNATTTQTFVYTDAAGNTSQCSFSVTVIQAPVVQLVNVPVSCAGDCNGQASLSISGTSGLPTVLWSNGQSGSAISNLCPGAYTATFTDAQGCSLTRSTSITQPAVLGVTVDAMQSPATGMNNGAIGVTVLGGTAPYTYTWKRDGVVYSTQEDLTNLPGGQYSLLVTDAHGCTVISPFLTLSGSVRTQEPEWAQGLRLQPNPARDQVLLTWPEPLDEVFAITIFDLAGRPVQQVEADKNATSLRLDLSGLAPGLWVLQIRFTNGSVAVRSLVVER